MKKLDIFVIVYLNDILSYIKDSGQPQVDVVRWVLNVWKHGMYANLKKCWFYKDEVQFLDIIIFAQGIRMEEKRIKTVKTWPES